MADFFAAESNSAVAERPKPSLRSGGVRPLPPYKVLLHNDDNNIFDDVALVIRRLTPLSMNESLRCAREAHDTGVALLLVTHRERAELYAEQFASCRLIVTIEPDA